MQKDLVGVFASLRAEARTPGRKAPSGLVSGPLVPGGGQHWALLAPTTLHTPNTPLFGEGVEHHAPCRSADAKETSVCTVRKGSSRRTNRPRGGQASTGISSKQMKACGLLGAAAALIPEGGPAPPSAEGLGRSAPPLSPALCSPDTPSSGSRPAPGWAGCQRPAEAAARVECFVLGSFTLPAAPSSRRVAGCA